MTEQVDFFDESQNNPLDCVEDILDDHNWIYSRIGNEELIVDVRGKICTYRVVFQWQRHLSALQINCQYNLFIPAENYEAAALAILKMNESLWMGHFELPKETMSPSYRQTSFVSGTNESHEQDQIEDLVDASLNQCEQFHHVFQILAEENSIDTQTLSLAMMETAGDA